KPHACHSTFGDLLFEAILAAERRSAGRCLTSGATTYGSRRGSRRGCRAQCCLLLQPCAACLERDALGKAKLQFARVKRLRQEIVCARFECLDEVGLLLTTREHEHVEIFTMRSRSKKATHLETRDAWHVPIEDADSWSIFRMLENAPCLEPITGCDCVVA